MTLTPQCFSEMSPSFCLAKPTAVRLKTRLLYDEDAVISMAEAPGLREGFAGGVGKGGGGRRHVLINIGVTVVHGNITQSECLHWKL